MVANIADIFPKHLFWDVDYKMLDVNADKDFIIPRALFATTEQTFDQESNQVCIQVARRYHVKRFTRF